MGTGNMNKFAEALQFLEALRPKGPWTLTALHPTARGSDTLYCELVEQVVAFSRRAQRQEQRALHGEQHQAGQQQAAHE